MEPLTLSWTFWGASSLFHLCPPHGSPPGGYASIATETVYAIPPWRAGQLGSCATPRRAPTGGEAVSSMEPLGCGANGYGCDAYSASSLLGRPLARDNRPPN